MMSFVREVFAGYVRWPLRNWVQRKYSEQMHLRRKIVAKLEFSKWKESERKFFDKLPQALTFLQK